MSIMFLKIRSVARGRGGNAVAKAAYVARDRLVDAAGARVHDYRAVPGLTHSAILLPADAPATGVDWARDRSTLWNAAEAAERRRDARVAREYTIALPHELASDERLALARDYAQAIADRYRTPVDLAVHGPTSRGDPRNHHAHILATTRELNATGLGCKATIELTTDRRRQLGLQHVTVEYRELRARWAELANERLRAAHVEARLEPRSRATLAREQARVATPAPPAERSPARAVASLPEAVPDARSEPVRAQDHALAIDEAQQRAAAEWRALRAGQGRAVAPRAEPERTRDRGLDAGFE